MGAINLPYIIANGDALDADKVMADLQAITGIANGSLQANSNVSTAAAVSQIGAANAEGVAATLARSDHTHILQGVESGTADPTTSNFIGRLFFRTDLLKLKMCIATAGSGTWVVIANYAAADVPIHGAEHAAGGHDPLANNSIATAMRDDQTVQSATLSGDVTGISTSAYTTIQDLTLTTTGVQTAIISVALCVANTHASNIPQVSARVTDQTAGGTPTISRSPAVKLPVSGGAGRKMIAWTFFYTVPATGARTLRVAAGCDVAAVDVLRQASFNADTFVPVTIQAVIL